MKIVAIIPSRGTATRYGANKALAQILDKPMIEWVHRWAKEADFLSEVVVATDDKGIYECVEGFGGHDGGDGVLMAELRSNPAFFRC